MSKQKDTTAGGGHEEEWPELLREIEGEHPALLAAGATPGEDEVTSEMFDREAIARTLAAARE